MREMPFDDRTFDAASSVAALDHLRRADIERALEVAHVLRPDGEFLLMVINPDGSTRLAYPHLLHPGYFGAGDGPRLLAVERRHRRFSIVELPHPARDAPRVGSQVPVGR